MLMDWMATKEGQIQMGAVGPHMMYDSNSKSLFAAISEAHKVAEHQPICRKTSSYTLINHLPTQSQRNRT